MGVERERDVGDREKQGEKGIVNSGEDGVGVERERDVGDREK